MTAIIKGCVRRQLTTWTTCACPDCRHSAYRTRKLYRAGYLERVPAEAGLAALDKMILAGWSNLAIASATGINENTVSNWLALRRRGQILQLGPGACAALVQAGKPTDGSVGALVPRRKLQALARIGHSVPNVAAVLPGVSVSTLASVRMGRTAKIHAWLAAHVDDAYRQLWLTPGAAPKTRNLAEQNRWPGPLSWDDIDDPLAVPVGMRQRWEPAEEPDPIAVWRVLHNDPPACLTKADRAEIVRQLKTAGTSETAIERVYGLKAIRYGEAS